MKKTITKFASLFVVTFVIGMGIVASFPITSEATIVRTRCQRNLRAMTECCIMEDQVQQVSYLKCWSLEEV